uniref:Uncharacterized protein n=1 Tax=viral metagenome TaxID=1070528 RepID=A0A6C0BKL9_9ZZZZ
MKNKNNSVCSLIVKFIEHNIAQWTICSGSDDNHLNEFLVFEQTTINDGTLWSTMRDSITITVPQKINFDVFMGFKNHDDDNSTDALFYSNKIDYVAHKGLHELKLHLLSKEYKRVIETRTSSDGHQISITTDGKQIISGGTVTYDT